MYTRKPKDMTKFLAGITSAQAFHTWEYEDKTRQGRIGSSALLSDAARKKRDTERSVVSAYHTSKIASVATHSRGEVARFTQTERQKLNARFDQTKPGNTPPTPPSPKDRPVPDASLYRRPNF